MQRRTGWLTRGSSDYGNFYYIIRARGPSGRKFCELAPSPARTYIEEFP